MRRPYDYYMNLNTNTYGNSGATQSEVDHLTLNCILKIIKEKLGIEINTKWIYETLSYLKNYRIEEFDDLQEDIDSASSVSEEEQRKLIEEEKKYADYKDIYKNLKFYHSIIEETTDKE